MPASPPYLITSDGPYPVIPLPSPPSGILIAAIADTQLQAFKVRNELLRLNGYPTTLINRQGEPSRGGVVTLTWR